MSVFAVGIWFVLWWALAALVAEPLILPGPTDIAHSIWAIASESASYLTFANSLTQIVAACLLAFCVALALSYLAAKSNNLAKFLELPVQLLKSIPLASAVVVLLIYFGPKQIGFWSVLLIVFPQIYVADLDALKHIAAEDLASLKAQGLTAFARFALFIWPAEEKNLQSAVKLSSGMAFRAAVAAELIAAAQSTIGNMIYEAKLYLDTPTVFAWAIIIMLTSYAFEKVALGFLKGLTKAQLCLLRRKLFASQTKAHSQTEFQTIEIHKLSLSFGEKQICSNLKLSLDQGLYLLDQPSGYGKTSLIKLIAGLISPDGGAISNQNALVYLPQKASLFSQLSILENVALTADTRFSKQDLASFLHELLPKIDITASPETLSGGELRRVLLVRSLVSPARLVLLDEPFSGLDANNTEIALAFLKRFVQQRCVLVAAHGLSDAAFRHLDF